jgi:ferrous iron transport protein A
MSSQALNSQFTLSTLAIGQIATISAVEAEPALQHRLHALGFKVGKSITVMRRASFNGPIHVRLGATDVILRPNDAKRIRLHQA